MIALDTSALVSYLAGEQVSQTETVDQAILRRAAVLPPVVLTELLSASNLDDLLRDTLLEFPLLDLTAGYWQRAGQLRGALHARGFKARLADTLIAQSCIDYDVPLVSRDRDFRHFARHGLRLV